MNLVAFAPPDRFFVAVVDKLLCYAFAGAGIYALASQDQLQPYATIELSPHRAVTPVSINAIIATFIENSTVVACAHDDGRVTIHFPPPHPHSDFTELPHNTGTRPPIILTVDDACWGIAIHPDLRLVAASANSFNVTLFDLTEWFDPLSDPAKRVWPLGEAPESFAPSYHISNLPVLEEPEWSPGVPNCLKADSSIALDIGSKLLSTTTVFDIDDNLTAHSFVEDCESGHSESEHGDQSEADCCMQDCFSTNSFALSRASSYTTADEQEDLNARPNSLNSDTSESNMSEIDEVHDHLSSNSSESEVIATSETDSDSETNQFEPLRIRPNRDQKIRIENCNPIVANEISDLVFHASAYDVWITNLKTQKVECTLKNVFSTVWFGRISIHEYIPEMSLIIAMTQAGAVAFIRLLLTPSGERLLALERIIKPPRPVPFLGMFVDKRRNVSTGYVFAEVYVFAFDCSVKVYSIEPAAGNFVDILQQTL
ncbi:hypothetical protein HDU83_004633 [Entophlyctis luteolus]|nr:hypothetical protein HDU83_004633 [Entophlyctis luteolus]